MSFLSAVGPFVSAAAKGASPAVQIDTGFTPTTWAVIALIVTTIAGVMTVWIKIRPAMEKIKMESDASLRTQLLERIGNLEEMQGQAAIRHGEAIANIKTEHAEEIARVRRDMGEQHRSCEEENRDLRTQLDGLRRQMILWQMTTGQAMPLHISSEQQRAIDKIIEAMAMPEKLSIIAAALGGDNAD